VNSLDDLGARLHGLDGTSGTLEDGHNSIPDIADERSQVCRLRLIQRLEDSFRSSEHIRPVGDVTFGPVRQGSIVLGK
jgi:hypothetical protein